MKANMFFLTDQGHRAHIEVDQDTTGEDLSALLEKLYWLSQNAHKHGLQPEKPPKPGTYYVDGALAAGTEHPPVATGGKPQAAPKQEKSPEGTLVDAVVKELDASVVPTEPGDRGIVHATQLKVLPREGEKVNLEFWGPYNDKPIGDYALLYIYNWGYEAVGKLMGWGVEYFKEPKTYEGNWNVEYELSSRTNKVGNYYKNVVAVRERAV